MPSLSAMFRDPEGRFLRVTITPAELHVKVLSLSGTTLAEMPWAEFLVSRGGEDNNSVLLSSRFGTLYLESGKVLKAVSRAAPSSVRDAIAAAHGDLHSHRTNRFLTLSAAIGLGLILMWGFLRLSGEATYHLVQYLPPSVEQSLGESAYRSFAESYTEVTDPRILNPLRHILSRFQASASPLPFTPEVHVFKSDDVNAMAFPGGKIVVCSALLRDAQSFDEIAGVLAHEFQHVALKHGLKNASQGLGFALGFQLLRMTIGLSSTGLDSMVPELLSLSFSRSQESEADQRGALLAHAAGFSTQGLITFLTKLERSDLNILGASFLSSHPLTQQRIQDLEAVRRSLPKESSRPIEYKWTDFHRALSE